MKNKLLILIIFVTGCASQKERANINSSVTPKNISLNGKLYSSFFMQRSAEYRALCFQAYNAARMQIQHSDAANSKPKAIITDVDETVLDNSPYAVKQAFLGKEYESKTWYEWTDLAIADTVPGAASFLKFAASKGIAVFYVTNREERERKSTIENLRKFNLPNTDEEHLLTKTGSSGKEPRRQQILANYDVILLLGDNLSDFSDLFDKKTEADRLQNADKVSAEFGKKFIILPNPNYGDWESSLYKYNYGLSQSQKDSILKSVLKSY